MCWRRNYACYHLATTTPNQLPNRSHTFKHSIVRWRLALEWAPPSQENIDSLQIVLYIIPSIIPVFATWDRMRMMPSVNTNVQAARARPASSQNIAVPRTQSFAYPAWILGARGVVHAGSRPSHVVARAKSDEEPDWNAEMSIFQKRISRPNQLATLRELEGKVAVGKVGHACM